LKVLIIGAAGFVGGHLMKHLCVDCGYQVCVTKLENEKINVDDNNISVYNLDILDSKAVSELLSLIKPDHIYHLAAQSSVRLSWDKPQLTTDINIKGTINVLEAVRELDYSPRILLVGSGEEYGYVKSDEIPINETVPLRAGNIYAVTKACQGMLGEVYSRAYNMDIIMVRAFNHIGPAQSDMFVVSDFCRQTVMIEKNMHSPVIMVGNLTAKRDFTDVRDIVRAYSSLMKSGKSGQTYNVGSGNAISIQQMLDMILEQSSVKISVETDKSRLRPSDVPIIEADISKITDDTGWKPSIQTKQTINDILDYWREKEK